MYFFSSFLGDRKKAPELFNIPFCITNSGHPARCFFLLYEHGYIKSRSSDIYYSTASARTSSYLARICFSILMRISLLIG